MSDYAWFELENGRQVYRKVYSGPVAPRSDLAAPMVISDYCEVANMADGGKVYTSKAALRASYRAKGYIEVGNERLDPPPKPKPDRKAIRNSVGTALNRVGISVDG